ncbi:MAG: PPC domain-containing protein, partial [Pirellula sp.]
MENRDLTRPTIGRDYRVNPAMIKLHACCCGLLIALGLFGDLTGAQAQMPLSAMAPQALSPGKTIRVEFNGNQFKTPLRVASSIPIEAQWISVEPTKAIAELRVPDNAPLGPKTIWLATDESVSEPLQILVDDLQSIGDNGANHNRAQPQVLTIPCAVDGKSDAAQSDFYQIHLKVNEGVSIDCIAERIGSTMDSVLRFWDAQGKLLIQADDTASSPDSQIRFIAPNDGDYLIEVVDNRFAGDGRYRMRVCDTPLSPIPYPLAIPPNTPSPISWILSDSLVIKADQNPDQWGVTAMVPVEALGNRSMISSTSPTRPGGFWSDVLVRDLPLYTEPIESESHASPSEAPLSIPVGITGRFSKPGQTDLFAIAATQGQAIQIQTITRSLGLPTLLKVAVLHPNGSVIAENAINEADEWPLEVTFPENGVYQIRATELLGQSSPKHAYWIEAKPKPLFSIGVKPDPKTTESRLLETGVGA